MANRQRRCTWVGKGRYVKRTRRCEERASGEVSLQFNRFGYDVTWVCDDHMAQFNDWLSRRVAVHANASGNF